MPRIEEAPGSTTWVTVPGFVITVIGRMAPAVRGMSTAHAAMTVWYTLASANDGVQLSAPRTIGAESEKSAISSSPRIVRSHGERHVADVDAVGVHVVGELGRAVGPARDLAPQELLGVVDQPGHQAASAPARGGAASACSPRSPMVQAESCARRSPSVSCGMRTFARRTLKMLSTGSPRSSSRTQGMRRPSWNTSVLSQAIVPGTRPPRSEWWATVTAKPTSVPPRKRA